jgi:hypothetical protein
MAEHWQQVVSYNFYWWNAFDQSLGGVVGIAFWDFG